MDGKDHFRKEIEVATVGDDLQAIEQAIEQAIAKARQKQALNSKAAAC